jgi:hypothetical protein
MASFVARGAFDPAFSWMAREACVTDDRPSDGCGVRVAFGPRRAGPSAAWEAGSAAVAKERLTPGAYRG